MKRYGCMKGIGKPEPLSGNLQGQYSRRVNEKDRLFYHMETGDSPSPTAEATMAINNPTQSPPASKTGI